MPLAIRAARAALAASLLAIVAACGRPAAPSSAPRPASESDYLRARRLMVPVEGIRPAQVRDTYRAPRGGGRRHNALDIMAPRGTPVLAADDGRVLKVRQNRAGGLTIYAVDDEERYVYYYAHLDRYRDGLREGERIRKGEVLGYVGTSGNAPRNTPHLHFQVMRYQDRKRWWDNEPVNPHPYLALEGRRARE